MIEIFRYEGESVAIGDHITVTVLEVDGEDVLLRIDMHDEPIAEFAEESRESRRVVLTSADWHSQSLWRLD